jgi:ribosomal protein S27AE
MPQISSVDPYEACPLCHTVSTTLASHAAAGAHWHCTRCAQSWTAQRLLTVAAYADWCGQRSLAP